MANIGLVLALLLGLTGCQRLCGNLAQALLTQVFALAMLIVQVRLKPLLSFAMLKLQLLITAHALVNMEVVSDFSI